MIDVNPLRDAILEAFPMPNVDGAYCFYYDETNNVRKLHLTPDGMNIRRPDCFVLGGIVHGGLARLLDRSTDECPAFAQYVISAEDQYRAHFVLEIAPSRF